MLACFDGLRDITLPAVALRLILAAICGGLIGIEREYKRRPAGFRTHILICLGAAVTTLTSEYLYLTMNQFTDIARFGAQVVAGVGIICGGTIIVTRQQKIKGLTTAAGLWTCAIIGLCFGAGFYEGGLLATVLILFAELFLAKLEYRTLNNARKVGFVFEYDDPLVLERVVHLLQKRGETILNMEVTRGENGDRRGACVQFDVRLRKDHTAAEFLDTIADLPGVFDLSEL